VSEALNKEDLYVGGLVVSPDPVITYSKRSTDAPLGLAGARPEAFRGRKALHLLGLSYTIEPRRLFAEVAVHLKDLASQLPDNRFIVLANSEFEAYLLSTVGVPSMLSSQAVFIDDNTFRPQEAEPRFDAIYNARLLPMKRHELARDVKSLGLLYDIGSAEEPPQYDQVKALLPQATFINHELGSGSYRQLKVEECAAQLNTARAGLCLSAEEGLMQAALEYLLCGLPVVSTRSIGGRDRYFMPPFCRVVPDDPAAIADAVATLTGTRIPKAAVRSYIMHLLRFERHNFLIAVNRLVKETFRLDDLFTSFTPFERGLTRWRKVDDALAPLAAA
jgi:glycosyltransferase involved in cell wall biosynthesis